MSNDPNNVTKNPGVGFRNYLSVLFIVIMLSTGLLVAWLGYNMAVRTTTGAANKVVDSITSVVLSETQNTVRWPVRGLLSVAAQNSVGETDTLEKRLAAMPEFYERLKLYPIMDSIYVGYTDGDFFMVRLVESRTLKDFFNAPENASVMARSIVKGKAEHLYFDSNLKLLLRRPENVDNYDPRKRDWYMSAILSEKQITIPPYLFFTIKEPGATFARKTANGKAVIAVDVVLSELSNMLNSKRPTPNTHIALFQPDGTLVAASDSMIADRGQISGARVRTTDDLAPIIQQGLQEYMKGMRGRSINLSDGQREWEISLEDIRHNGDLEDFIVMAIPKEEVLAEATQFLHQSIYIIIGILVLSIPIVWLIARRVARPLKELAAKVQRIMEFKFDDDRQITSNIAEIALLSNGIDRMQNNIREFLDINHTINSERKFDLLLEKLIRETIDVAEADGGLVALFAEDKTAFEDGKLCWINEKKEATIKSVLEFVPPDSNSSLHKALRQNIVTESCAIREDEVDMLESGFDNPAVKRVDVVSVPLYDRMKEKLGVLALFKTIKPGEASFRPEQLSFIGALGSMAAIALDNHSLLNAQRELRDAMIHIIAGAIDAKSHYTGGHCERVPELFRLLLEAACDSEANGFKDFKLDEDDWEEAKLAGWLHDCGKLVTPEYVVDKATKLETIYDRIHEIRTRFEVLKRDAVIESLRTLIAGGEAEAEKEKLKNTLNELDDDFAFVAKANAGGEFMKDEDLARLTAIGKRTWMRTLDKKLGVSREELLRQENAADEILPVREQVLMDRPEQVIARDPHDIIPEDNLWQVKLPTPKDLYNRGELYNLSVRRGTLTEEERYIINEHSIRTMMMLSELPWPKHLRMVADIAASHHEKMDGTGYPRCLTGDKLGIPARMLAIADIFEALTASDRPYKPGKTVKEALKIMEDFKEQGHIDPAIYQLFAQSGVPKKYADKYLKPEQNDL